MRNKAAFLGAMLCAAGVAAQSPPSRLPVLPPRAASAEGFVPRGWTLETEARGDLDGDGASDLAFVLVAPDVPGARLRSNPYDDDPSSYANPRMLGIAFARPQGGFRLALSNHGFLPPKWAPNGLSQGWMLFEPGSVELGRRRLRVTFQYTRSHTTFTFRWQGGALRLTGFDTGGVEAGCVHSLSVNFLTGRAKLIAQNIEDEDGPVHWRNLGRRPLLSIGRIGNGEEFDPAGLVTGFPLRCRERE